MAEREGIPAETLAAFEGTTPLTTAEVAEALGISRRSAYDRLDGLADRGEIATKKVGARGRVWWRPADRDRPAGEGAGLAREGAGLAGEGRAHPGSDPDREPPLDRDLTDHLLEAVPGSIVVLDPDGEVVRANERAERRLDFETRGEGYTVGDVDLYDEDGNWIPPEDRPYFRVFETGEPVVDRECQIDLPGEGRRWISINAVPLREEDVDRVVVTARDITRLKEQAERLERQRDELESELSEVFERVDDAFYAVDEEFRFTYVNERAEELLRHPEEELLGESVWSVFPDARETDAWDAFHEAMESQEPTSYEFYFEPLEFRVDAHVYPSETGLSVYFRDVTAKHERDRRLEELRQRFRKVFEHSNDGIFINDPVEDEIIDANPAGCEMLGYSREELLALGPSDCHPDEMDRWQAFVDRVYAEDSGFTDELTCKAKDGERLPVEMSASTLEIEGRTRMLAIVRDISDRKARERKLRESERRYRTLAEQFPNGAVLLFDDDLRYTLVEGQIFDDLSLDPEEMVGNSVHEVFSEEHASTIVPHYRAALAGEQRSYEVTYEGRAFQVHTHPVTDDEGEVFAGMAMTQDVTDRKQRERALEEAERGYNALADNLPDGAVGVYDENLRYTHVSGAIWDDIEPDAEDLEGRTVAEALPEETAEDLEPVFRDGLEGETASVTTRFAGRTFEVWAMPVRTGDGEEFAGLSFSVDITDRVERERQLERQRERLAALDELNAVVRDINEAILEQSSREEVEQVVCERLAASDSYTFACIFEPEPRENVLAKRVEAGVEGYVEEIEVYDDVEAAGHGPGQRAVETGEMQVVHHAQENPEFERWQEAAEAFGYRSLAAVPISHEEARYGVLGIYSERPEAFDGQERKVVEQLGEIVGSTIAAAQRKHALMGSEVVEVEFRLDGLVENLGVPSIGGRVEFDRVVPAGEDRFLAYGTVTGDGAETLEAMYERLDHWTDLRTFDSEVADTRFELLLEDPPVASGVAEHGGSIEEIVFAPGESHMTIQLPPGVDVRNIVELVDDAYPAVEMMTRRQVSEPREERDLASSLTDDLTDRQRTALEVSYYAGFFEWPRENSGDEIAESLDVSAPTYHQHLRAAQKKLLAALLE